MLGRGWAPGRGVGGRGGPGCTEAAAGGRREAGASGRPPGPASPPFCAGGSVARAGLWQASQARAEGLSAGRQAALGGAPAPPASTCCVNTAGAAQRWPLAQGLGQSPPPKTSLQSQLPLSLTRLTLSPPLTPVRRSRPCGVGTSATLTDSRPRRLPSGSVSQASAGSGSPRAPPLGSPFSPCTAGEPHAMPRARRCQARSREQREAPDPASDRGAAPASPRTSGGRGPDVCSARGPPARRSGSPGATRPGSAGRKRCWTDTWTWRRCPRGPSSPCHGVRA